MRLLHTTKLRIEEFVDVPSSKYAILSHTWGDDEVTFQDMQAQVLPKHKKGFSKIHYSCIKARNDGNDYIWIDTCCIDKSSSAELSEAINPMYRWYKEAKSCYAYLCDVPPRQAEDPRGADSSFRKSRWFTRGWTLQELIAPQRLVFLSETWRDLGTKENLTQLVSEITGIDYLVLLQWRNASLSNISVARKMSWASKRVTTPVEDGAYSLLGIFNVNMPLLYGEGGKAFIRLQEEILKQTNDESLFAHQVSQADLQTEFSGSLLAQSPRCFSQSADIFLYARDSPLHELLDHVHAPSMVSNKGLQVHSFGCPCSYREYFNIFMEHQGWLMILDCRLQDSVCNNILFILRPI